MKTKPSRCLCLPLLCLLAFCGCENTDYRLAAEAGIDAVRALSLSEAELHTVSRQAVALTDKQSVLVAPAGRQAARLKRLLGDHPEQDGHRFDLRVYQSTEVNAFATADGSIRLCSALVDMMDDGEVLFVVGHEMGHVVKGHARNKIMLAYAGSAVRKGVASQEGLAGDIAQSALGGIAEQLVNARFSRHEEQEADDYGRSYLESRGLDRHAAVTALRKLAALGGGHTIFSSHPDPDSRARRLQGGQEAAGTAAASSRVGQWLAWGKNWAAGLLQSLLKALPAAS